jgi:endo-1,4-beta-xylanase
LVSEQFSSVTPENVMKWQFIEPTKGVLDFTAADKLVEAAQANGQLVRGHTLAWHSQMPDWFSADDYTPDELRAMLKEHIAATVTHFKGKIWQWDVVNEAYNDDGTPRDSFWLRALGPRYIADSFRWAHEADPDAQLFYNDYNISWAGPKSDAVLAMVKQLKADGVPIDGVGFQGHLGIQYDLPSAVTENYQRFADIGLKVAVTEADVRMIMPEDETKLATQAKGFEILLDACLRTKACESFTVWGFNDKHSWVPSTFEGEGSALIMTEDYQPKPSFFTLQKVLAAAAAS